MTNELLIKKVEYQISEMARTGGRSHIMCVPPENTDTDMILSELVHRFKSEIVKSDYSDNIKYSDLILIGYEESYYEWFQCPKCKAKGLSKNDNYCNNCGIKIID